MKNKIDKKDVGVNTNKNKNLYIKNLIIYKEVEPPEKNTL